MSGQIFLITEEALVATAQLAMANPIRTVDQQRLLVEVCTSLDNPLVSWSGRAGETWEGSRCRCGRAIPVMAAACGDCLKAVSA